MAKDKLIKNITIDKLAIMVQKGFEKTATSEQMENLEKRFDKLEKDVKEIKTDLKETIKRTDKLEMQMDYVENVLDVPAK